MQLQLETSKKKLILFEKDKCILLKLWSYDPSFSEYEKLLYYDENEPILYPDEAIDLSTKLKEVITKNNIFESNDKSGNLVIFINPPASFLGESFIINPVSNSTLSFLYNVIEFLSSGERILLD